MAIMYVVYHDHGHDQQADNSERKIIGVYNSYDRATTAQASVSRLSGFKDALAGFLIKEVELRGEPPEDDLVYGIYELEPETDDSYETIELLSLFSSEEEAKASVGDVIEPRIKTDSVKFEVEQIEINATGWTAGYFTYQ